MSWWYRCPVCEAEHGKCEHARITGAVTVLPCPFCQGPPVPFSQADNHGLFDGYTAHVFCHECGAEGPYVEGIDCDADEVAELVNKAVLLWNARNDRHRSMYDGGTTEGLNLHPRPVQPGAGQ